MMPGEAWLSGSVGWAHGFNAESKENAEEVGCG